MIYFGDLQNELLQTTSFHAFPLSFKQDFYQLPVQNLHLYHKMYIKWFYQELELLEIVTCLSF